MFKKDDEIRCIERNDKLLTQGKEYHVLRDQDSKFVFLEDNIGQKGGYYANRFELVEPAQEDKPNLCPTCGANEGDRHHADCKTMLATLSGITDKAVSDDTVYQGDIQFLGKCDKAISADEAKSWGPVVWDTLGRASLIHCELGMPEGFFTFTAGEVTTIINGTTLKPLEVAKFYDGVYISPENMSMVDTDHKGKERQDLEEAQSVVDTLLTPPNERSWLLVMAKLPGEKW